MAKLVWTNPKVLINAVDLSAWVRGATLDYSADALDATTAGKTTKVRLGGLKDWTLTVNFAQDYAASAPDVSLFALMGTSVAVSVVPVNDTVSATNPNFNGNAVVTGYGPARVQIGAVAETSVTLQGNDTLSRTTTP